jgi:hypothetical protein
VLISPNITGTCLAHLEREKTLCSIRWEIFASFTRGYYTHTKSLSNRSINTQHKDFLTKFPPRSIMGTPRRFELAGHEIRHAWGLAEPFRVSLWPRSGDPPNHPLARRHDLLQVWHVGKLMSQKATAPATGEQEALGEERLYGVAPSPTNINHRWCGYS